MLTIGIDPGTAITGYGLVREGEDGVLAAVSYGVIATSPDLSMPARLLELDQQLQEILLLYRPDCGAVEKLFFARNARTALAVGQGRGVVLLGLARAGVPVAEYTPLEIKQTVVGYGGAGKKQVQHMVKALLKLDQIPQPDDAADALAIAICHLHHQRVHALIFADQSA